MRNWNPWKYQRKAMKFLLEHAAAALWLDPGLGKTSIVLGAFKILKNEGQSRRMLVIAPLRPCYLVWPAERDEWAEFTDFTMTILHGPDKETAIYNGSDIFVINPEGLDWLMQPAPEQRGRTRLSIVLDGDKGAVLAVDEVTKFKHPQSKRFKTLKPYLGLFGRRWTLTGTCAPNGYLDLFGQVYVADEGAALGRYITHYKNTYFQAGGYGNYTWTLCEGSEKLIQRKLKPLVLRMDADDYLELPTLMRNPIIVTLPPDVRRIYDALEEEMYAVLGDGKVVTAMSAAAASIKCRQVANGGIYTSDADHPLLRTRKGTRDWIELHSVKTDAVLEIVEELQGKPVFITYDFHHDLARLRTALGKDVPVIGGKGSGPAGMRYDKMLEAAWNADKLPFLLGHPASIGHGLNLQKSQCGDMIIHSDTWDQELYDQVIRRIRRQGNTVGYLRLHHIIAHNTVDQALYASHDRKGGIQKALMDSLKAGRTVGKTLNAKEKKLLAKR